MTGPAKTCPSSHVHIANVFEGRPDLGGTDLTVDLLQLHLMKTAMLFWRAAENRCAAEIRTITSGAPINEVARGSINFSRCGARMVPGWPHPPARRRFLKAFRRPKHFAHNHRCPQSLRRAQ